MPDSAATAASAPGGGVPVGPPIAFLGTADPAMATCLVEADISRTENGNARNGSPGRCRLGKSIDGRRIHRANIALRVDNPLHPGQRGAGLWMYTPRQIVFPTRRT